MSTSRGMHTSEGSGSVSVAPNLPGLADAFNILVQEARRELREGYAEVGDERLLSSRPAMGR